MRFGARVAATLLGMVAFSAVAIGLAVWEWGVWSLVVAYLVRTVVTSAMYWLQVDWRPRWHLHRAVLGEMLGFSTYVMAANILAVAASSVDKILVGRILGPTSVGFYSLAFGLAFLFRGQIGPRLYQVAFPAFAEAQDDLERLRRGAMRVIQVLLSIVLPFGALIGVLSRDALSVAYGSRWAVAAPVLSALAGGGALAALGSCLRPLLLARGHSRVQFVMSIVELGLFLCLAPWATATWGLIGAGAATSVSVTVSTVIRAVVVSRDLSLAWHDWVNAARPAALSAAAMIAAILGAETLARGVPSQLTPLWHLALFGGFGASVGAIVLWRADPEMVRWLGAWIAPARRSRRHLQGDDSAASSE
jgi:PST family polysaccharide transporter